MVEMYLFPDPKSWFYFYFQDGGDRGNEKQIEDSKVVATATDGDAGGARW